MTVPSAAQYPIGKDMVALLPRLALFSLLLMMVYEDTLIQKDPDRRTVESKNTRLLGW
jgi:hypothetical protein